jgi:hypothetical protein
MSFDPARDGWRLQEAIMRLSDPAELAALGRLCAVSAERDGRPRLPPWWLEANAPAGTDGEVAIGDLDPEISARCRAIEQAFIDRLASGTTVGWARRGSPMDPYERVPADAWRHLGRDMDLWDWRDNALRLEEVRSYQRVSRGAFESILVLDRHGSVTQRHGERPRPPRELVQEVVLRLFAVRIQPPDALKSIGKSASEAACRSWLAR